MASAAFALLSLTVQYSIGRKQAVIGTRQAEASRISADAASLTAKNAGDRAIATMRIQWISELMPRSDSLRYESSVISLRVIRIEWYSEIVLPLSSTYFSTPMIRHRKPFGMS
jgi:hypothetical protein